MNISLTPTLENFLKQKVATGLYNSSSEVVREALRLLEEKDVLKHAKLELLRKDLTAGIDSLDNGRFQKFDIDKIITKARNQWKNS